MTSVDPTDGHSPDPCGRSGGGVWRTVSDGSRTGSSSPARVGVVEQRCLTVVRHELVVIATKCNNKAQRSHAHDGNRSVFFFFFYEILIVRWKRWNFIIPILRFHIFIRMYIYIYDFFITTKHQTSQWTCRARALSSRPERHTTTTGHDAIV